MSGFALNPHARADLKAIWTYTAERWNTEQAVATRREVPDHASLIRAIAEV